MIVDHSIFEKIVKRQISSDIVYQDKIITAFKDIKPQAPVHILIVPNNFIQSLNQINENNKNILTHMMCIAISIAKEQKIHETGYRIVINCNKNGGQEINYLHIHLLGGKKLESIS